MLVADRADGLLERGGLLAGGELLDLGDLVVVELDRGGRGLRAASPLGPRSWGPRPSGPRPSRPGPRSRPVAVGRAGVDLRRGRRWPRAVVSAAAVGGAGPRRRGSRPSGGRGRPLVAQPPASAATARAAHHGLRVESIRGLSQGSNGAIAAWRALPRGGRLPGTAAAGNRRHCNAAGYPEPQRQDGGRTAGASSASGRGPAVVVGPGARRGCPCRTGGCRGRRPCR